MVKLSGVCVKRVGKRHLVSVRRTIFHDMDRACVFSWRFDSDIDIVCNTCVVSDFQLLSVLDFRLTTRLVTREHSQTHAGCSFFGKFWKCWLTWLY